MTYKPFSFFGKIQGGYAFKSSDFKSSGIPIIKIKNVKKGFIDYNGMQCISEELYETVKNFETNEEDILISMTGSGPNAPASIVGRVARVKKNEPKALINQRVGRVILFNEKKISKRFLFYFISQKRIQDFLVSNSTGSANQANINNALIESIQIPDITYEKSCLISDKISCLDDQIDNNDKISLSLNKLSQAMFKSWFFNFDPVQAKVDAKNNGIDPLAAAMEVISGKSKEELQLLSADKLEKLTNTANLFPDEFEETEFGQIPKGWKWKPLYDTAEYVNGSSFKSKDFSTDKSGLPIIKIAELKSGVGPQTKFTNAEVKEKYAIDNGSLLYSWSGSPETSLEVFKWFGGKGWLNQHIFLINTSSLTQKVYVFNLLTHMKPVLIDVAKNKQTTGLGHITVADMKRIHVAAPDENGLKAITEYLVPLYQMDSNNTLQNENLKQQRDTLIPKLLSGELEIN